MKISTVGWSCVWTGMLLSQQMFSQTSLHKKDSQKTLLQKWALSRCLAQVFTETSLKDDANATASAYLEFGTVPAGAYDTLSVLVDTYAKRTYTGSVKSDYKTMKCIDLFSSNDLDRLTSEIVLGSSKQRSSLKR